MHEKIEWMSLAIWCVENDLVFLMPKNNIMFIFLANQGSKFAQKYYEKEKKIHSYRIYSRIGREILDDFQWNVFLSDLYTGHKL
jgi:hypothetical protein